MHDVIRGCSSILTRAVRRNAEHAPTARNIFDALRGRGDISLVSDWIRDQVFAYGLFSRDKRPANPVFLDESVTKSITLLPVIWDLNPAYD
jgi:hypothetical protein